MQVTSPAAPVFHPIVSFGLFDFLGELRSTGNVMVPGKHIVSVCVQQQAAAAAVASE